MKAVKRANPKNRILPSHRAEIRYLEHCRVHMAGERLTYAKAEGAVTREWNIPAANTSAVLLGPGGSITQAAARKLAEERTLVGFVGGGGLPTFLGSINEYAPTEALIRWVRSWARPSARLAAAKCLAFARCRLIPGMWRRHGIDGDPNSIVESLRRGIERAADVESLRGFEGTFAKALYREAARATSLEWSGRQAGEEEQDQVNAFLDQGNYIAYGAAGVVLWTLGIPPGLAVNHGTTRAGGLVFDLADVIKDAMVLPIACLSASLGASSADFRDRLVEAFDRLGILSVLFGAMEQAIQAAEESSDAGADHIRVLGSGPGADGIGR